MTPDPDLSILLTAQPRFLEDRDLGSGIPVLPAFSTNGQQVNDPRRPRPIVVETLQQGGGSLTAKTIPFLAPSNGAFGIAQVFVRGEIQEMT